MEGVGATVGAVGRTWRQRETYRLRCASTSAMRVRRSTESAREPVHVDHAHIAAATLDVADVAGVEAGLLREPFLRVATRGDDGLAMVVNIGRYAPFAG